VVNPKPGQSQESATPQEAVVLFRIEQQSSFAEYAGQAGLAKADSAKGF